MCGSDDLPAYAGELEEETLDGPIPQCPPTRGLECDQEMLNFGRRIGMAAAIIGPVLTVFACT
jgi:hypothetical protein